METVTTILVLLLTVVASSTVSQVSRKALPLPLVQIMLGALIAQSFDLQVSLAPETFFLLFVAPLLFLDGWRTPRKELARDKWTILAFAFGLVLFTVLGAGLFIHWLIPAIPLSIAFALAAVLSPTDAVAVSAIGKRAAIPKRLMLILEGESLLNDASGLVCLRFAIAAAVTGTFSLIEASTTFLWLAIGGVGIGVAVALVVNSAKDWTARHFGEESGTQILTSLLIPFAAYLVADRLAASGILAAVAAGVAMGYEERAGRASAGTRIRRAAVWDAVQFASNGVIFVLLGDQLPSIIAGAGAAIRLTGQRNVLWLILYVLAITAALTLLRAVWAWATLRLSLPRPASDRSTVMVPSWRLVVTASLAGVRGAVTLSGVMTLPLYLKGGAPFPTRDLVILLAAGVIILTLLIANIGLPVFTRQKVSSPARQQELDARLAAARAGIAALEHRLRGADTGKPDWDLYQRAARHIIGRYQQQIEVRLSAGRDSAAVWRASEIERELHLVALHAERKEFYRIAHVGGLTEDVTQALVRDLDLQESRYRSG